MLLDQKLDIDLPMLGPHEAANLTFSALSLINASSWRVVSSNVTRVEPVPALQNITMIEYDDTVETDKPHQTCILGLCPP
jgi:hypothetical protein